MSLIKGQTNVQPFHLMTMGFEKKFLYSYLLSFYLMAFSIQGYPLCRTFYALCR